MRINDNQMMLFEDFENLANRNHLTEKINEALTFLRSNIPKGETVFVGFSGGKDSIVTAKLLEMSGVKHQLYYSHTGLDSPEVVRFIRKNYPLCQFLKPKRSFWKNLSTNVPPSNKLRWCCTALKKEPGWQMPHKYRVMGIRSEESVTRRKVGRIAHFEKRGHTHYHPIFDWDEWEIWAFIDFFDLRYPELYDWGFDRIGCVICPYHSGPGAKKHSQYRERWPGFFGRWEKGITDLYHKRKSQGKKMAYDSPEQFLNAWYRKNSASWYRH